MLALVINRRHNVHQTLAPSPARDWLQSDQYTVFTSSARSCQTGWHLSVHWTLYSFPWSVYPDQEVSLRRERWSGIRLQSIQTSLTTHLVLLYITMVRGEADGRPSGGGITLLRYRIVSFGMPHACSTSLCPRYGQLRRYSMLLSSFMLLYVPLCRSYAALWPFLALQIVKLRCFEMICSHKCSAMYSIENADGEENETR